MAEYYATAGAQWQRWSSTRNITRPAGISTGGPAASASVTSAGNAPVYAKYIAEGYFSLVALNYTDTTSLDGQITADLRRNHHYHIIQVVPYGIEIPPIGLGTYVIWQHQANRLPTGPLTRTPRIHCRRCDAITTGREGGTAGPNCRSISLTEGTVATSALAGTRRAGAVRTHRCPLG